MPLRACPANRPWGLHSARPQPIPRCDRHRLVLEDRYEEVHQLLDNARSLGLKVNDRTALVIQRAGERLRKRSANQRPERPSWQTPTGLEAAPRLRFGM